jgi:hypothetical protein
MEKRMPTPQNDRLPARYESEPDEAARAEEFCAQLLAGQTPQQRAIAVKIFDRLKAGAEVAELKDLIGDLSKTATADEQRRKRELEQEKDSEQDWEWQWNKSR